jgi:hypothetical protein
MQCEFPLGESRALPQHGQGTLSRSLRRRRDGCADQGLHVHAQKPGDIDESIGGYPYTAVFPLDRRGGADTQGGPERALGQSSVAT